MMRAFRVALLAVVLLAHAHATLAFPPASISELGAGFLGDPNVQFVEIRFDEAGAPNVTNTRLTVFDKDGLPSVLLLTPGDVASGAAGRTLLYATSAFQTSTGVTPDFVIPPAVVGPSGMVCWGAPAATPPDPASWDADKPESYADCVAYGGYPHATRASSGTPTTLPPGDGARALTRIKNTSAAGSNDADFALASASPCNNAEACGALAPTATATATPIPQASPSAAPTAVPLDKAVRACRRAIVKAATKFAAGYVDARVACETRRRKGTNAGVCPDEAATAKVARLAEKRTAALAKACAPVGALAAAFGGVCPGYAGSCTNAIADAADVSSCLDCGLRASADALLSRAYASPPDPALLVCQRGFGKAIASHYRAVAALRARCEDAALRGKSTGSCPDPKTAARIAAKETKLRRTLCKACGGADKTCNGAHDVTPAALGMTACPARSVPGGGSCGAIAIASFVDVVNCVECLAAFETTCASQFAARPTTLPTTCSAP